MKRIKNILKKISIIFIGVYIIAITTVFADVGDFESYDSGSSWSGGSSWSSGSDWDSDSGSSFYISGGNNSFSMIMFFGIAIAAIIYAIANSKNTQYSARVTRYNYNKDMFASGNNNAKVINQIKAVDELFNEVKFSSWANDLFVKLQYAWSDRDWEAIRVFETEELYEQHLAQLNRYIQNKQINKIERVSVSNLQFLEFSQIGGKDILSVTLDAKMTDYIIDEQTGNVLKGNRNGYNINKYKLTFVRKTGIKTKAGDSKVNVTNCPNCGAPTEITSAGKCNYCGSVITTGNHDWALSALERVNFGTNNFNNFGLNI